MYPNGSSKIIPEAIKVDQQNFHEGMFDFYDARGNLLKTSQYGQRHTWDEVAEAPADSE